MAADGMSWYFQLVDRITPAAKDMTRSLSSVSDSLKSVEKAAGGSGNPLVKAGAAIRQLFGAEAEGTFYKGASGIASMLDKVDKVIPLDALKKIGGALLGAAGMVASFVGELASTAAAVALAAGVAVAALVAKGFQFAVESADFKRNTLMGLQTMLGTSADAKATLEELEGYAKKTGMQKDAFVGFAKGLLGAGFQKDELRPLLGALSDIQALNGNDAGKAQELMAQLVRIKSLDKVSSRELASFGGMGISSDKIFQALADQRHITLTQAKNLFDAGNLKSEEALTSILKAIQTQSGGKLGAAGLKMEEGDVGIQLSHLKDAFGDLFENVNTKPIADFLVKLNETMGGPVGEKFTAAINKAFDALARLFNVDGDDLDSTLDKLADGFTAIVDWAIKFGVESKQTWDKVEPGLERIVTLTERLVAGPGGAGAVWMQLGIAFEAFVGNITAQLWVFEKLYELSDEMTQIGVDIVTGLWQGLQSGWADLMSKFHELVGLLPEGARKILGIQSPSRVFADLGAQTGAGFSVGLDASDIPGTIRAALVPPPSPSISALASGSYASQGAPQIHLEINVNVDGGGARDDDFARRIADEVRVVALPALMEAAEQLTIELGG